MYVCIICLFVCLFIYFSKKTVAIHASLFFITCFYVKCICYSCYAGILVRTCMFMYNVLVPSRDQYSHTVIISEGWVFIE